MFTFALKITKQTLQRLHASQWHVHVRVCTSTRTCTSVCRNVTTLMENHDCLYLNFLHWRLACSDWIVRTCTYIMLQCSDWHYWYVLCTWPVSQRCFCDQRGWRQRFLLQIHANDTSGARSSSVCTAGSSLNGVIGGAVTSSAWARDSCANDGRCHILDSCNIVVKHCN